MWGSYPARPPRPSPEDQPSVSALECLQVWKGWPRSRGCLQRARCWLPGVGRRRRRTPLASSQPSVSVRTATGPSLKEDRWLLGCSQRSVKSDGERASERPGAHLSSAEALSTSVFNVFRWIWAEFTGDKCSVSLSKSFQDYELFFLLMEASTPSYS